MKLLVMVGFATAVTLVGCAQTGAGSSDQRVTVTVLAAASLKDVFTTLKQFEAANPPLS